MRTAIATAALVLVAVAAVRPASGQPDIQAKTAAEAAFRQGKDQLAANQTEAACESFKKSQDLDPQLGTNYNLGLCYEKLGRLASAWGIFSELAATDTNKGRRADAAKRVKAIGPRLVRVLVVVRGDTPGLRIKRSGVDITAAIGVATPVDPGMEQVVAEADGYKSWSAEVSMAGEGTTITVEVPALEKLPEEVKPPPDAPPDITVPDEPIKLPPPAPVNDGHGRRVLGLAVAGVGVAALGAGAVLGMSASSKYRDAQDACGGDVTDCRGDAAQVARADKLVDSARSRALFSTIAFAAGGAAVVGGVVLYLTAPRARAEKSIAVAPGFGPGQASVVVSGRF